MRLCFPMVNYVVDAGGHCNLQLCFGTLVSNLRCSDMILALHLALKIQCGNSKKYVLNNFSVASLSSKSFKTSTNNLLRDPVPFPSKLRSLVAISTVSIQPLVLIWICNIHSALLPALSLSPFYLGLAISPTLICGMCLAMDSAYFFLMPRTGNRDSNGPVYQL